MRQFFAALLAMALISPAATGTLQAEESKAYAAFAAGKYLTALELAQKEAEGGSKEAYTLIGEIYSEGLGVPEDFDKAADAYAKGADLGDTNAQLSLGLLMAEGLGVKKDVRMAANLFEQAADSGNPAAQYNLALMYLQGQGRAADEAKAAEWMTKVAESSMVSSSR